jgi:hypothetical protein
MANDEKLYQHRLHELEEGAEATANLLEERRAANRECDFSNADAKLNRLDAALAELALQLDEPDETPTYFQP